MMTNIADYRLTRAELKQIEREGVSLKAAKEHVRFTPGWGVELTPRGMRYYKRACERWGVSTKRVDCCTTAEQLADLLLSVRRAKRQSATGSADPPAKASAKPPTALASSNVITVDFRRPDRHLDPLRRSNTPASPVRRWFSRCWFARRQPGK